MIDLWRWYFGEPASIGGGIASPVYQSPNDEVSVLVLDYPGRLLAELSVAAVFRAENRLELYGADGAIIADGVLGARQGGSIICKGEAIPISPRTHSQKKWLISSRPSSSSASPGQRWWMAYGMYTSWKPLMRAHCCVRSRTECL